jgi:hypothetical protein
MPDYNDDEDYTDYIQVERPEPAGDTVYAFARLYPEDYYFEEQLPGRGNPDGDWAVAARVDVDGYRQTPSPTRPRPDGFVVIQLTGPPLKQHPYKGEEPTYAELQLKSDAARTLAASLARLAAELDGPPAAPASPRIIGPHPSTLIR